MAISHISTRPHKHSTRPNGTTNPISDDDNQTQLTKWPLFEGAIAATTAAIIVDRETLSTSSFCRVLLLRQSLLEWP